MDQRVEFCMKAVTGVNFRGLCREYGISAKTGYKWKERFLQRGLEGMEEESRRPHGHSNALSEREICDIIHFKNKHPNWGPKKIRELYLRRYGKAPSESSCKRVLERCGMTEKRVVRKAHQGGRLFSGKRAQGPNEVWTCDFKGWWRERNGVKCEPLTVRDEYTRYVLLIEAVKDARTETVRDCFEKLFGRYGVPGAIRSDNGSPFASVQGVLGLSRLSAWWVALGIDLERSRPGCPQDNGGHERLHLDISRELEGKHFENRQAALDTWKQSFNFERPHEALGMKSPGELYEKSSRRYDAKPIELIYFGMEVRKVNSAGFMKREGEMVPISKSLSGWQIGLNPRENGRWGVQFAHLLLGEFDPHTRSFLRADQWHKDKIQTN